MEALNPDAQSPYAHTRRDMERVGQVYRALRDRFSDAEVDITLVDPRNTVWLFPAVWRDARRRGLSVGSALRQVRDANRPCTLICNGMVLARDATAEQAVGMVEADLSARPTR